MKVPEIYLCETEEQLLCWVVHLLSPYYSVGLKCLWVPFLLAPTWNHLCTFRKHQTPLLKRATLKISKNKQSNPLFSVLWSISTELMAESALPRGCALLNYLMLITVHYGGFLVINGNWVPTVWRLICCLSHLLGKKACQDAGSPAISVFIRINSMLGTCMEWQLLFLCRWYKTHKQDLRIWSIWLGAKPRKKPRLSKNHVWDCTTWCGFLSCKHLTSKGNG